jgi:tetratricopeptide (TPR) repeat protein
VAEKGTIIRIGAVVALAAALFALLPAGEGSGAARAALEALWKSGEAALEAGDIDTALQDFEAALELDRHQPRTWNYLGGIHFHRQDYFKALLNFKQAFALDPWDAKAGNNVATAYEHLGQYERAEQLFLRAIEIDENYTVPYRNLGVLYARHLNRPDLARKYWEAFLAAAPRGKAADEVREELEMLKEGAPDSPSP